MASGPTPKDDCITKPDILTKFGVPSCAKAWFYTLIPAVAFFNNEKEENAKNNLDPPILIAWDKPSKSNASDKKQSPKKVYGIFQSHIVFYDQLSKLDNDKRYAYEIIPKNQKCKAYWDIEFEISDFENEDKQQRAKLDILFLLKQWIKELKSIIKDIFKVDAKVCTLDGSRVIETLNEKSAFKFSFHVIVYNLVFETNQSKAFKYLREKLPTLYESFAYLKRNGEVLDFGPKSVDKFAPDMGVWKENQIFRCIHCSKRGGSTPLTLLDFEGLSDSEEILDTFITYLQDDDVHCIQENFVIPEQKESKKRGSSCDGKSSVAKRRKQEPSTPIINDQDDDYEIVDFMKVTFPQELNSIQLRVQELLKSWNDHNTAVEKLVRAKKNLRFQCRNVVNRPCIFSHEIHSSNTPIIWLDAPSHVHEGELSNTYSVIYNCKSSECMCQGIIGQVNYNAHLHDFEFTKIFPARLLYGKGPVRSMLRKTQAVIEHGPISNFGDNQSTSSQSSSIQNEASVIDFLVGGISSPRDNSDTMDNCGQSILDGDSNDMDLQESQSHAGKIVEVRQRDLIQEKIIGAG